jgi:hypothetical protein
MRVLSAPGRKVRDPISRLPIPAAGVEVSETDTYWARRLADGDVVIVAPAKPSTSSPPKGGKE